MNVAITERGVSAAQPLKDKVSLSGSTSGIGLGTSSNPELASPTV